MVCQFVAVCIRPGGGTATLPTKITGIFS